MRTYLLHDGGGVLFNHALQMKTLKYGILPLTIAMLLVGAGCASTATNANQNTNTQNINAARVESVSYAGQAGKNALELLQAAHTVEVTSAGFVDAIDGVKPVGRQYWAFYVNNSLAEKGAKDIITKTTDQITWKLESY